MRPWIAACALALAAAQIGSAHGAPIDAPVMPGGALQWHADTCPAGKESHAGRR